MVGTIIKQSLGSLIAVGLICSLSAYGEQIELDRQALYREVLAGRATLLDVRQSTTEGSDSIAGALWIKFPERTSQLPETITRVSQCLPKGRPVYLFCDIGQWAGYLADRLLAAGVNAVNTGGYSDWSAVGLPRAPIFEPALNEECPFLGLVTDD